MGCSYVKILFQKNEMESLITSFLAASQKTYSPKNEKSIKMKKQEELNIFQTPLVFIFSRKDYHGVLSHHLPYNLIYLV